ncbi:MAG: hypothetical protein MRT15_11320 [archaeon YNP-LCB-003-016]|uniref:hypothetical protein n=1 Tax=Candidatus Culexarchaeum yellowstonense TaxID=2928963 RepID=UPI0026F0A953|nr:hypothetical protein [Candidatus Culexarchaeum yellowstonense]MCR6692973.1 hypothetical protein [Candidatus Culexarchaeum yellowstonense]
MSLDACIDKLRYVKYGDEVKSSDVLDKLECIRALRDALKAKAEEAGCPSEVIDPLVDELDAAISKIRYVKSGDVIEPEDHNYIVDALKKARDILVEIESYYKSLIEEILRPGRLFITSEYKMQVSMPENQLVTSEYKMQVATPDMQNSVDYKFVLYVSVS